MRARTLLPVAVLLLASTARAQEAPPPAAAFAARPKPNPAEGISLQLEDADLGELVRTIGEITGKRFVIASPKLAKVKASVFAPQKVSVAETGRRARQEQALPRLVALPPRRPPPR